MSKQIRINVVGSGTIEDIAVQLAVIANDIKVGHYTSGLYQDGVCQIEDSNLLFHIKDISL